MTHPKGLILNVYRSAGRDCTLNGITSDHDTVVLVGIIDTTGGAEAHRSPTVIPLPAHAQVFEARDDRPAVYLVIRQMGRERLVHLVPAEDNPHDCLWKYMAGGNYAATSDSRFHQLGGFYGAIAVHDRNEYQAR